jgi:heptosyltransferase III
VSEAGPERGQEPDPTRDERGRRPRLLVLFPGALGDLLCCWPALDALRRSLGAALTLAAREPWFAALPEHACTTLSIDRREFADLFASDTPHPATGELLAGYDRIESWTGYGDEQFATRLREVSGAAVTVHPFRALRAGEHAMDYYARCAAVTPAVEPLPVRSESAQWAAALWDRHSLGSNVLTIHPGSGSQRKNWEGAAAVAAAWRRDGNAVIVVGGPSESAAELQISGAFVVRDEPLDRIAALLARTHRYLGNDSGISHLAGLVGAHGIAAFGDTDPDAWRPRGTGIRVLRAATRCRQCGSDRFCTHRLSVDDVLAALRDA